MGSEDNNIFKGSDNLTTEDQGVGEMLRFLKRVEAPGDFSARVNERIAIAGTDARKDPWFWPVPAYIISLVLIVVAGSFFLFLGFGPADTPVVPEVASGSDAKPQGDRPGTPDSVVEPGPSQIEKSNSEAVVNGPEIQSDPKNTPLITKRSLNLERMHGGGSMDSSSEGVKPIMPRGFDPNNARHVNPSDVSDNSPIPVANFLKMLGIAAKFEGEGLRTISVGQGSIAERSGVRIGDIIMSLGDKKITPATVFRGRIEARSITVNRDGRPVTIKLGVQ